MIRLEMNKKQEAILAAIILVAAFMAFALYSGLFQKPEPEPEPEPIAEPEPPPPTVAEWVAHSIEIYDNIDNKFLEQLSTGEFTFDNPLIAVNPYAASPLTALIMFWSETPMTVTVTVNGKTPNVSISHTYYIDDNYKIIPVYGLYPNMVNLVELEADGLSSSLLIETGSIPEWFPLNLPQIETSSEEPQPLFFTFVRKSAFDINGDYRWCYTGFGTSYHTNYRPNANILMIVGSFDNEDAILLEINLLGRVISAEPIYDASDFIGYGIHHTVRMPLG